MRPVLEIHKADAEVVFASVERSLFESAFDLHVLSSFGKKIESEHPRFALSRVQGAWALEVLSRPEWRPLVLDYTRGAAAERLKKAWLSRELLKDALGFRKGDRLAVVDGTAGLLSDATLIAAWGHCVKAFEQNPVLCFLGLEALEALKTSGQNLDITLSCAPFSSAASLAQCRAQFGERVDRVYLDPLYPSRPKEALNSKELRIVAGLAIGQVQPSLDAMIDSALSLAPSRVVVKRPQWESPLQRRGYQVTACKGRSTRFDVLHALS